MQIKHIIGVDLSKATIDFCSHYLQVSFQVPNTVSGFKQFTKWLKLNRISRTELLIVMEHTGLYSFQFEEFLHKTELKFCKVAALAIKRSLGLIRGKTDKLDAIRIARYGFEKKDKLIAQEKPSPIIQRLQMLQSSRESFVKTRTSFLNSIQEYRRVVNENDCIVKSRSILIKELTVQIKQIEAEIDSLVKQDEKINCNASLLQSITGVGPVLSVATIIKTKNFTCFDNSRKFSCCCGTAPFAHTSGSSIMKRSKVSHLADKHMKVLLDLAARSAIQHDPELKNFYQRRLLLGKSKISTLNIVRNKIIGRMFAVINRQTPFVENYLEAV